MQELKKFVRENQILLLTWVTGLLLTIQVINMHTYVALNVEHQSVIAARDDDASWNVAKAVKTRWWKDNGWVLYGPAYFRLAHTMQYFWGRTAAPAIDRPNEVWERTAHHAIMTISLLSLVGTALLIATVLVGLWWQRFLLAMGFLSVFLSVDSWTEFLLRAHPDHLFTLVVIAALALTLKMFQRPTEKIWFLLSAILWGVSVSVKMTLSVAAPGFFLLFIPPFSKENFRRGLKYLGVMLAAYFLIGFPQSIVLGRVYRSLAEIGGLSTSPNWDSLAVWFAAYGEQLWRPAVILILAWICFDLRKNTLHKISYLRVKAFVLLPFLVLLSKNMLVPSAHYVIPFAGMLVFFLAFNFGHLPQPWVGKYPLLRASAFLALILIIFGSTPQKLQAQLQVRMSCGDEARQVYKEVVKLYDAGENIWVDPYVPYITKVPKDRVDMTWDKNWEGYAKNNWTVFALQKGFRAKYTGAEVSEYTQKDTPGWRGSREFYLALGEGDSMTTPQGHTFKRIYQDQCGHELWQRQK